jgi:NADPH:quinone reductase-like Zn-dependent oxidoreductase/SAM-dependent methyltransferase
MSALKLSYHRGALASKLAKTSRHSHCMASIGLSQNQVYAHFNNMSLHGNLDPDSINISCINSPKNVTISGPEYLMNTFLLYLEAQNLFVRRLAISVAYHSPQMREIASEYLELIGTLETDSYPAKSSMISSVSCQIVSPEELSTGQYWVQNMVSPVDFNGAMKQACAGPNPDRITKKLDRSHLKEVTANCWLEMGPHSTMQTSLKDILSSLGRNLQTGYASTLIRDHSGIETILAAAGSLVCRGFVIDTNRLNSFGSHSGRTPLVLTDLPHYPFDHSIMYWEESRISREFRFRKFGPHELLGSQVSDWNALAPSWAHTIRLDEMLWVKDHKINGSILYPAAGMLAMALEATKQIHSDQPVIGYEIKDAIFHTPLLISGGKDAVETQINLRPITDTANKNSTWYEFRLYVYNQEQQWEEICRGSVRADISRAPSAVDNGREAREFLSKVRSSHERAMEACSQVIETHSIYTEFKEMGLDYGPAFRPLDGITFNNKGKSMANVMLFSPLKTSNTALSPSQCHVIHPTTLDGIFQLVIVALSKRASVRIQTMVPTRLDKLWVSASGLGAPSTESVKAYTEAYQCTKRSARASISVVKEPEQVLMAYVEGLEATSISSWQDDPDTQETAKHLCYHMKWGVDLDTLDEQQTLQYCNGNVKTIMPEPIDWFKDIEFLALALGSKALKDLHARNQRHLSSFDKYISWLQGQLERDMEQTPPHQRLARTEKMNDSNYINSISERMLTTSRGRLYVSVGNQLSKVLLGEIDPLQLLFDKEQLAGKFYEEMNDDSQCFHLVARYLEAMVHKTPGMSILEIGAGTGATTKRIHKILAPKPASPHYGRYDFTDISPSFFDKAKEGFDGNPRVAFHILDIEIEPTAQGFEEASYDLVIAAHVLHATKILSNTVQNARKLLKPGGKLILVELTVPGPARTGFAFGLLPGWWLGSEHYRQASPCIDEKQWNELLMENGFSGTDVIFRDYESEECHVWSLIISTATPSFSKRPPLPKAIAIVDKGSQFQLDIATKLDTHLSTVGSSLSAVHNLEEVTLTEINHNHCILLSDLERPLLRNLRPPEFSALQVLLSSAGSILWVSRGGGKTPSNPDYGMIQGLCRVSRQEHVNVPTITLGLEIGMDTPLEHCTESVVKVFRATVASLECGAFEPEWIEMNGLLQINRLFESQKLNDYIFARTAYPRRMQEFGAGPPLKLNIKTPGLLDSLEFIEDEIPSTSLNPDEVEVKVHAVGVNFKECLTVLGQVDTDTLGSECAGVVTRVGQNCCDLKAGDRVALCSGDTYRTFARAISQCAVKIPDNLSFSEAAALPTALGTAYYSLCEIARLRHGESILIHAASGGTGQAAVQLALHLGAQVFATVGSLKKKQLLIDRYGIPEDHIFYSRDLSFADGIKRITKNRGVDVVLNSLSGQGLVASWECIAPYGRFLEIGRKDIDSHNTLPMHPFLRNALFIGIDLTRLVEQRLDLLHKMLADIISLLEMKRVGPSYPLNVLPISQMEQAFRTLQSGQSTGKIVLEITEDTLVPVSS